MNGLGILGSNYLPKKSKYRYYIEGKDSDNKIVFPYVGVRLHRRPPFPYMASGTEDGGELVRIPGEVYVDQIFNNQAEAMAFVHESPDVKFVELKCMDGEGNIWEKWYFKDTTVKAMRAWDEDECIVEWRIQYISSEWDYDKRRM